MIPKRDKNTDISTDIAQGKFFQKRLRQAAEEVSSRFINGDNLNEAMADVSKRENFNQIQIQRLVEEGNTLAFNKKYNEVKKDSDRRVSFELGDLPIILSHMGSEAPPAIDNPNLAKGKAGEGELKKEASTSVYVPFSMNSQVDASRKKMMDKQAATRTSQLEKEAKDLSRSIESGIFKVAQSIVQSERLYRTGNEIFNNIIAETGFDDFLVDGIMKKAHELTEHMKNTGRAHSGFMVSLELNPEEKTASSVFGSHSLMKVANETAIAEPKIKPIQDVADYQQLISLAKEIQRKQEQSLVTETELHGGVPDVK